MRCEEIRELLSGYLDGELDERERKLAEEHLGGCPACAEELRVLRGCVESIGSLEEVEPPADFLSQVHGRLEKKPGFKTALGKIFSPLPLRIPLEAAAAAAVVILVIYLVKTPSGSLPDKTRAAATSFETRALPDDGLKQEALNSFQPNSGLWAVRGGRDDRLKQESFYARAEKAEMVPREAAPSAPAALLEPETQALGLAEIADAGPPPPEPAIELVLLVEPGTGFFGKDAVSRARMKAVAYRQFEAPILGDSDEQGLPSPLAWLEDLVDREGGEIISREARADGTRRLLIKLPPDRYRPFREGLSRISDLPPAGPVIPGQEPETFRFRLTAE